MADVFDGQRVARARHLQSPGQISSSPEIAGLPLFTFFSTSYPDLNWDVLRHARI
jgi:hypothetical protein